MAQIKIVGPAQATGKSQELLTALQNNIKSVPSLAKALANSPAALKAGMEFDRALAKGNLNAKLRQEIALAIGQKKAANSVCAPPHRNRQVRGPHGQANSEQPTGQGISPKDTTALTFARELLEKPGAGAGE